MGGNNTDFMDTRAGCSPAFVDHGAQQQDFPVRVRREKLRGLTEALCIKTIKNDVIFKNHYILRPRFQTFTQAAGVRFIHPLFDIDGMTPDDDEFNPSIQSHFGKLGSGRLPSVFAICEPRPDTPLYPLTHAYLFPIHAARLLRQTLFKRSEFVTTDTELKAMAAAANSGLSRMPKKG